MNRKPALDAYADQNFAQVAAIRRSGTPQARAMVPVADDLAGRVLMTAAGVATGLVLEFRVQGADERAIASATVNILGLTAERLYREGVS